MEQLTSKSTQFDNASRHHQIMTFAQFITERQMANAYESQITAILDTLGKEGYTFKRTTQTGSIIKIFTKKARFIVVQELLNLFANSRISEKKDTVVLINGTPIQLVVKPSGKQGFKSAGLGNEQAFKAFIQNLVNTYGTVSIRFVGSNGSNFLCKNVTDCVLTGTQTSNRRKADAVLLTKDGKKIPISLKKNNAEYWESADTYYGARAKKILDALINQNKIELKPINPQSSIPIMKINRNIAVKANEQETTDVVFGSDILNRGCVIQHDFERNTTNYTIENKIDEIIIDTPVNCVFKTVNDVLYDSKHAVYFLIRNDKTRASKTMKIKGIRILATYKKRINPNVLIVEPQQLGL